MKKTNNTRAMACQVLMKVLLDGISFQPQLVRETFPTLHERDAAFVSYLCFGVLRYYPRLQEWANAFLHKPLKAKDTDLLLIIMIGLFQLFYSDTPEYAALHTTVAATEDLGKPWARGLINSLLRQALRNKESLSQNNSLVARTAHPLWLIKAIKNHWPNEWEKIIEDNLMHPPLTLRVNLSKISREDYLQHLQQANIPANALSFSPAGIVVTEAVAIDQLPGFDQGWVSVQDEAAQLAAYLLDLQPKQRVLDACAAPGGKLAHLYEVQKELFLLGVEKDPKRMSLLKNTCERLGVNAEIHCADATMPESWWQEKEGFDRILLDAPCSATGVIRRHPDIKLHRQPEDINDLTQLQAKLLTKLWPLLKPNGILLYVTCSILPDENVNQIAQFLAQEPTAQECPIIEKWGSQQQYGRQLLPGQHNMDGFYFARLHKKEH
ncbi:MAG: 16S rRNA (cytosine(967)-C(5))-methyltransferase RsmB [Candidatus Berkiellales bacterium]